MQYETDRAFVTIGWDARSGELDLYVGLQPRNGEARDAFSLTDLLAMNDIDVPERKTPFQVTEEGKLGPFLDKLAVDAQAHAQPALAGDRMFFRRLKVFRSAQAHKYMRDMKVRRIRAEAERAWQNRELEKLIILYTAIEEELRASEKAKLAYAKQKAKRP